MHEKIPALFFLLTGALLAFLYEPVQEPISPLVHHLERSDKIRQVPVDSVVIRPSTNQIVKLEVPLHPPSIPRQPEKEVSSEPSETEPSITIVRYGPATSKMVALTFDDGPHPTLTPKILEVLREHHVKATFFVLGNRVKRHPNILRQIVAEGHEIGNHTYSHIALTSHASTDEMIDHEITQTQNEIKSAIGYEPHLFRPPYGAFRSNAETILQQHNFSVVLWSIDTMDWRVRDRDRILQSVTNHVHNGSIILCHDIVKATLEALPDILDALQTEGYQFATVSELCGLSPVKLTITSPSKPSPPQQQTTQENATPQP